MLINVGTKQPFTYKDACVIHGPHTGYDPEAAQAAKESVNARAAHQINLGLRFFVTASGEMLP
jgi:hypothetical protein